MTIIDVRGAKIDVLDVVSGPDGRALEVSAAIYAGDGRVLASSDLVTIEADEDREIDEHLDQDERFLDDMTAEDDAYDTALFKACSQAEERLAEELVARGMPPEDVEDLLATSLIRSDMPAW